MVLYDVFHPAERQRGFAWFNSVRNYDQLDYPPAETEAAKKRLHFGEAVHPRPCFFLAKVTDAVMECHPENIEIRSVKQGYNAATNG